MVGRTAAADRAGSAGRRDVPAAGFTTVPPLLPASESSAPADPAATPVSSERPDLTVDVRGAVRTLAYCAFPTAAA